VTAAGSGVAVRSERPPIPPLIRRNSLPLALAQAFVGAGTQLVPTLGGIMIERLLGSLALVGPAMNLMHGAGRLVAWPVG
jgi:hypothetical protein